MRALLTTIGEILGAGLVSYGAWMLNHPAGLIVAGLALIGLSVAAA
jgi:hypothetical protein